MDIKNLQFFDYNGYNLNFSWNENFNCWEGSIYLPKVSVGLYVNTTVYVLEQVDNETLNDQINYNNVTLYKYWIGDPEKNEHTEVDKHYYICYNKEKLEQDPPIEEIEYACINGLPVEISPNSPVPEGALVEQYDYNQFDNNFVFPTGPGTLTFHWDKLNTFVDEFFMFTFDDSYTLKETSSLVYTPNDGPDCETLIVNTFDKYEIPLDNTYVSKALPIHIGFMANEKYDATTYSRTLIMSLDGKNIARITFFTETIEEDERLKVWNSNLGYNITPEDTMMFYKSDIKEYMPNYKLLNEKRKELMMEGSNIYPYVGSYKAIINAIKFFGYENLNIIEYWKNVNPDDENFGKIYHSSKYSLTHKETLRIGARNITLPNKDYKKINSLALVYSINEPTSEIDEWELPQVKEKFTYTIEEAIIKLFALRKKLNKEFMPGTSKIIDIIGEASYFGIQGISKINEEYDIQETSRDLRIDFEVLPNSHPNITDNAYFVKYINITYPDELPSEQIISDISGTNLTDIAETNIISSIFDDLSAMDNNTKCNYYKNYYREIYEDYTRSESLNDADDYPYDDYTTEEARKRFSAKVILNNTSFQDMTFDECELKFDCKYSTLNKTIIDDKSDADPTNDEIQYGLNRDAGTHYVTFNNIDTYDFPNRITWKVVMSKPDIQDYQLDDEYKNVGLIKAYKYHNINEFEFVKECQTLDEFNQVFVELPYVGYYDVTMELGYDDGEGHMKNVTTKTRKKFIKVEPYQIELKGFYYDARELPKELQYEEDNGMLGFAQGIISNMYEWARSERNALDPELPIDASMPYTETDGTPISVGPYRTDNVDNEWYLADNISLEMSTLEPLVKYTRYIKSGVDVKPYTWFLLGYDYTKIVGKINPHWTITHNEPNIKTEFEGKKYLTLLLKKEGTYTVTLDLEDKLGNVYSISRNIIVVSKSSNYDTYQSFKTDYDFMFEQDRIKELNEFYEYEIETPEYMEG